MPLVSLVIPVYNAEHQLKDCFGSILNQEMADLEIIVVDDGSTDQTKRILEDICTTAKTKAEIRCCHQENRGAAAARNVGLAQAEGEYIAFLDADDLLLEQSLNSRRRMMEKHPEIPLVFGDFHLSLGEDEGICAVLDQRNFLEHFAGTMIGREGSEILLGREFARIFLTFSPLPIWTGTVMIRRTVLDEIGGFDERFPICHDTEFWMSIIRGRAVGYIHRPLAVYRHELSFLTRRRDELYYRDQIRMLEQLPEERSEPGRDPVIRARLQRLHFELGWFYRSRGRSPEALRELWHSFRLDPRRTSVLGTLLGTILLSLPER